MKGCLITHVSSGERILQSRPFGDETVLSFMHCGLVQTDLLMTTLFITVSLVCRSLHDCISEARAVPWLPTLTAVTESQYIRSGRRSRIGKNAGLACGASSPVEVSTHGSKFIWDWTRVRWLNFDPTTQSHCSFWCDEYKSYNIALYITIISIHKYRIH